MAVNKILIAGVKSMVLAGETVKADKEGYFTLTDEQMVHALPFTRKPVRIQNSLQGYRVPKPNNLKPVAPVAVADPVVKPVEVADAVETHTRTGKKAK